MAQQFNPKTGGRGIEWADRTENPIGGCVHECKWRMPNGRWVICYAKNTAENTRVSSFYPQGFAHHYWRPHMLKSLVSGRDPQLIFCDSMSDLFAANVPPDHVSAVLAAMRSAPHHAYQSLTKAAPVILRYLEQLPANLWVGVSSPPDSFMGRELNRRQQTAMLVRSLSVLRAVKARGNLVWMSAEPVSWDLADTIGPDHGLDWIVIGAASDGPRYFQPEPDHIARLLELMDDTKTPVFFKGNLGALFKKHRFFNEALNRWREDFPTHYHDGSMIAAVAARQRECQRRGWTLSLPVLSAVAG